MKHDFNQQMSGKTNQELLAIFTTPDDYQDEFILAAKEELHKRNIDTTIYEQQQEQKEKLLSVQLANGKPGDPTLIVLGFISACLGGLLGIFAGYTFSQSKHKTKTIDYYTYDEPTRKKGVLMMFIGALVFLAFSIYKLS
jgi:hypothetical protein